MKRLVLTLTLLAFVFYASNVLAQDATVDPATGSGAYHNEDTKDLAKEAANPIANMISLPFQFNFNFGVGEYNRTQTVINFQPVLPFRLSKTWNVVTRTIIPIIQQPVLDSASGGTFGIGNTSFNAFFVPKVLGIFTYGFGISLHIPTASAPELGSDAFGIGPTIVFLFMPGNWVVGATAAQVWSYKSPEKSNVLNSFFAQYFITYNIKNGWFVNSTPTITANFNADSGQQWVVPFGAGFGKVQNFNKVPVKFMLQYYYNVVSVNYNGAELIYAGEYYDILQPNKYSQQSIVFQVVFLFPK